MKLAFTKMHGAGNDFVVIDGVTQAVNLNTNQLRRLADRHRGIGCDQILMVTPPTIRMPTFVITFLTLTVRVLGSVATVRGAWDGF